MPFNRLGAAALTCILCHPAALSAQTVQVGQGSYTTVLPVGEPPPSRTDGRPAQPLVTEDFSGPIPTNDWWTSLLWDRSGDAHSGQLYAHPLAVQATANGLEIRYPDSPTVAPRFYYHDTTPDLTVRLSGLSTSETRVVAAGDFSVTARWVDDTDTLEATMGHGFPFVYFRRSGANVAISPNGTPHVWSRGDGVVGVTVRGHHYGIFGPTDASWSGSSTISSDLAGKDYFAVAVLPERNSATLEYFRQHAYAHITDTRVSWEYDATSSRVSTTFEATTELKEEGSGHVNEPLFALYRHQWLNTDADLTDETYLSPRGEMRVVEGTFQTHLTHPGILPSLPAVCGAPPDERLVELVENVAARRDFFPSSAGAEDTYWDGKAMGRLAELILLADKAGLSSERTLMLTVLKSRLQAWFSASSKPNFWYDDKWTSLIGFPDGFGSSTELNDHHFHYGYFVKAAAVVAKFDPDWARFDAWGGMVELLIRDVANWDRTDERFPFLRSFDPYAGHSWASGHGANADGNNQEASSESMNFAAGVALWGMETGNEALRDLGLYLFATELSAIEQYWFDIDGEVFPRGYGQTTVAQVWGNKGSYETFFGNEPEFIHGINFLPFTAASLYLGRDTSYAAANYANMISQNGGSPDIWFDLMWQYQALSDPASALINLNGRPAYPPEAGESRAHTYDWISTLHNLGTVEAGVTADVPSYGVFSQSGARTYAAYNPSGADLQANFSDGTTLTVEAGKMGTFCADATAVEDAPPLSLGIAGIYPNPAGSGLTLTLERSAGGIASVALYDLLGRRLTVPMEDSGSEVHLDVRHLPPGLYVVQVGNGDQVFVRPVVVAR